MNLGQVVSRRLRLQWQLQVKLLPDRGVHDATREDVREAAIVTRAPGEQTDTKGCEKTWGKKRKHFELM